MRRVILHNYFPRRPIHDASYRSMGFTPAALAGESLGYLREKLQLWKGELRGLYQDQKSGVTQAEKQETRRDIASLEADISMIEKVIAKKVGRDTKIYGQTSYRRAGDRVAVGRKKMSARDAAAELRSIAKDFGLQITVKRASK